MDCRRLTVDSDRGEEEKLYLSDVLFALYVMENNIIIMVFFAAVHTRIFIVSTVRKNKDLVPFVCRESHFRLRPRRYALLAVPQAFSLSVCVPTRFGVAGRAEKTTATRISLTRVAHVVHDHTFYISKCSHH